MKEIVIENAAENNLKNVSLHIPHYKLIVVTGVSGSGKTSLVYDVLCAEGQRLFYENFVSVRYNSAKIARPKASKIEGLFPVIAVDQGNFVRSPRSTVGTLTELYDLLRLLFARLGKSDIPGLQPSRSLFSFNLSDGYCPVCKGLGVCDHIDPGLLIADETKTIRGGAFALTTPNNYIIYSQVTMDVLDQVCRAEGFNVDIPWKDLTPEQQDVVLNGSAKIKVLFGKHPLESRLNWTGITAKPREEDYYKGILPVMEDILRRDRNPNIMRFARSHKCEHCSGRRLNDNAMSVRLWGRDITSFSAMTVNQLNAFFAGLTVSEHEASVVEPVRDEILRRTSLLQRLGAGHLTLDRESASISGGEAGRIRLANHVTGGLRNVMYIIDEPSAGLHPSEQREMLEVLRLLVSAGNTVMLIDHDEQSIREADWIIDIGPGAGGRGGHIMYNGPAEEFFNMPRPESLTRHFLSGDKRIMHAEPVKEANLVRLHNVHRNNLKNISPSLMINSFNVITGVSGSGKSGLADFIADNILSYNNNGKEIFRKVIHIDSSPIGRTPKSNPATYTGLSDHIRDLLASLPESHQAGFKKGQFSFVVKGGRCETCGGAGYVQMGMHFMGNVQVLCDTCEGKRFTPETLAIRYRGLNIYDMLELTVDEACHFFEGHRKITDIAGIMADLGLGYLKLGQPSTTLSGGEARRIKLASELSRQSSGKTLYIIDEPSAGLHMYDNEILIKALRKLVAKGNTLLCIENDPFFILNCDWITDLGPGSGEEGGNIVAEGPVSGLIDNTESLTAAELRRYISRYADKALPPDIPAGNDVNNVPVYLKGVTTNNLKDIDVLFPAGSITAVTGISGSGKTSLVFGTLYAESQRRFLEGMSSRLRQYSVKAGVPALRESRGLIPAVAIKKKNATGNPRSTVATYTGLYDLYRLLYSRLAKSTLNTARPLSSAFSFNSEEGACEACKGLGAITVCSENKLVTNPDRPLVSGALDGTKTGRFYGDPYGRYVATLLTVGEKKGYDFSLPYNQLTAKVKNVAMYGCGEEIFEVDWHYKRGSHEGVHYYKSAWPGFLHLVEEEYERKHADARGEAMMGVMASVPCTSCNGHRLKPEMLSFKIAGMNIGELAALPADDALPFFKNDFQADFESELDKKSALAFSVNIIAHLEALVNAGLGYISTDRIVGTLSGGEFQRLQLAGLTRAPLCGVAYILDEPSFGLHPVDLSRIGKLITDLNNHGNTVIMVDNSPSVINLCNHLVELGPGAGKNGGYLTYAGSPENHTSGINYKKKKILQSRTPAPGLVIKGACANNLKNIDLGIKAGIFTVISGVSGSGKTSLLEKVIFESLQSKRPVFCKDFSGSEKFSEVIYIEQAVAGKDSGSTTGSRLGISDSIAKLFALSGESKKRNFRTSHFVKGSKESRCPVCEGTGQNEVSMDFFNDIVSPCEKCGGTGFRDEILEVKINGLNIFDVLQLQFEDLPSFVDSFPEVKTDKRWHNIISLLLKTGLGHLSCGRALNTLSTGELQRLKLVAGLSTGKGDNKLILLDEPTGGLHQEDVVSLLKLFDEIIGEGNTIACVTHEPLLFREADVLITLGPGGGRNGGKIIAAD